MSDGNNLGEHRRKIELAHKLLQHTRFEDLALSWMCDLLQHSSCSHTKAYAKKISEVADKRIHELTHEVAVFMASRHDTKELTLLVETFDKIPGLHNALTRLDQSESASVSLSRQWLGKIADEVS